MIQNYHQTRELSFRTQTKFTGAWFRYGKSLSNSLWIDPILNSLLDGQNASLGKWKFVASYTFTSPMITWRIYQNSLGITVILLTDSSSPPQKPKTSPSSAAITASNHTQRKPSGRPKGWQTWEIPVKITEYLTANERE